MASYLRPDEPFCFTYGDGVGDVDIRALIDFHKSHGLEPTVTVVRPPGRFGAIVLTDHLVTRFAEKPLGDDGYINGGFFVVHPKALQRIAGDHMPWELAPLDGLAADRQLAAYRHDGFWQPMDTLRARISSRHCGDPGRLPGRSGHE